MVRKIFFSCSALAIVMIGGAGCVWPRALWAFAFVAPLIAVGLHDVIQKRHSLLRIYPLIGHGRYLLETLRPEIQQYFVESNTDGMPYSREFRSLIYQRSKRDLDTEPFGTQRDVDRIGYEWMTHSLAPLPVPEEEPRVLIGGPDCTEPYSASHLNISAMSFGALSRNAVLALNGGAQLGGFAHNTGEGGLSPYHLERGGDLVWQIGTGYCGCRSQGGRFDAAAFRETASAAPVKMI